MNSLQGRLGVGLLISLLAVFSLLWFMVSVSIRDLVQDYITDRMQHDAEALIAAVQVKPDGNANFDYNKPDAIYSQPFSGHYFVIQVGQQKIRSRSLWDQELEINTAGPRSRVISRTNGPRGQPLLVLTGAYQKNGRQIVIAIAEDQTMIEADITEFQTYFALVALGFLVTLIVLQTLILRLGMRPLADIQHEVNLLERGERGSLSEQVPDEVRPLIGEINQLLQALTSRLQRSRDSLGDLAHSLKKPLAVLSQLQQDEQIRKSSDLSKTLGQQVSTMRRATDRILKRARLAGASPVNKRFDIETEIPDLIDTIQKIHMHRSISMELDVSSNVTIHADREDMLELLGNLLDNAFKWAEHKCRLSIHSHAGLIQITVEDDGPGIPEKAREQLLQRGTRLDEQVEGHGLGLAISQDIVQLYHGSISIGRSEKLQGLSVQATMTV